MITLHSVFARIERQKIKEFSGRYYLDKKDLINQIPYFQKVKDQQFLFGIYKSESIWTVISVNYLYSCYNSNISKIRLDNETKHVFEYFSNNDFSSDLFLDNDRKIWLKSPDLSSLILNVMLMLEKIPCGTILK